MQPFEDLFNQYSKELRERIHVDGFNSKEMVNKQIEIAKQLNSANNALISQDFRGVLDIYKNLSYLSQQTRNLNLEGILYDNFALEQFIGLAVAERASENPSYQERFLKKFNLGWIDFFDEDQIKEFQVSRMVYGIDFSSNSWRYNFDRIGNKITSEEEINNPFLAAYLMQNMTEERNAIYSEEVITLLSSNIQ